LERISLAVAGGLDDPLCSSVPDALAATLIDAPLRCDESTATTVSTDCVVTPGTAADAHVCLQPAVGIRERMDDLTRLRHAQQRIVRIQRRLWLAQVLMWPAVIAAGVSSVAGLVWFLRHRSAGGRHEMPDTPGAHEAGTVKVAPNSGLTPV
jgi:hypothetical protein